MGLPSSALPAIVPEEPPVLASTASQPKRIYSRTASRFLTNLLYYLRDDAPSSSAEWSSDGRFILIHDPDAFCADLREKGITVTARWESIRRNFYDYGFAKANRHSAEDQSVRLFGS